MMEQSLDSVQDIEKIARNLLVEAKALGHFPTPVDRIIRCAELSIENGVDLSQVNAGFFLKSANFFGRISRKVLGIIDFRAKTIYLDESQQPKRKNFVKLHEVGHAVLPWQSELLGCKDDETTIVADVNELYEREASIFASDSLFQLDRFDEEAAKLELGIRSARTVGNKFGGSAQAALRRYVQRSPRRCSLLVLHRPAPGGPFRVKVRNYFESLSFQKAFGGLTWPDHCGVEYPFVQDIQRKRRDHRDGQIGITTTTLDYVTLQYHFFDNGYNVFVFLFPPGEKNRSRVQVVSSTNGN